MAANSTTRRNFFGLTAGAALVCTIGDETVRLDEPGAAAKADAAAARVRKPKALEVKDPVDALTFGTPQPQPGGDEARVLDPGREMRLGHRADGPRRLARPQDHRPQALPRVRLPADAAGLRRCRRPGRDARPDARGRGRRHARRALPQRDEATRPGGHDAPARRQATRPTTTASTWATSRAPAASSRPARSSRTRGRRRPTRSASGPTTTTARTTR